MHTIHNTTIVVDGHAINVLQAGDDSALPILFLHGKAFQAETWQELGTLEAVADAGLFAIALDLPGFGRSPEAPLSPDKVITAVMRQTNIAKAIIVGPSMGGKIALEYTLEHPERIAGLTLIGSVGIDENRNRLAELPSSTLILWGENDQISDPANAVLLHKSIPGSRLVVFSGAKHPCYLEQPKLWHESLLTFAKKITG